MRPVPSKHLDLKYFFFLIKTQQVQGLTCSEADEYQGVTALALGMISKDTPQPILTLLLNKDLEDASSMELTCLHFMEPGYCFHEDISSEYAWSYLIFSGSGGLRTHAELLESNIEGLALPVSLFSFWVRARGPRKDTKCPITFRHFFL